MCSILCIYCDEVAETTDDQNAPVCMKHALESDVGYSEWVWKCHQDDIERREHQFEGHTPSPTTTEDLPL